MTTVFPSSYPSPGGRRGYCPGCGQYPAGPPTGLPGEGRIGPETVTYHFYGDVDARASRIGAGADPAGPGDGRLRYTTGGLHPAVVQAIVSGYVPPRGFDQALRTLRRHRVLVLEGKPGSGRRAGAIALLRAVTDRPVVLLPPTAGSPELAEWDYQNEHCYLVVENDETGGGAGVEGAWAAVAERVRAAGSYLVVTAPRDRIRSALSGVRHLAWEQPPLAEVIRRHLDGNWPKDTVDNIVAFVLPRMPVDPPLRWVASLARLVNARRDPARALHDLMEVCGREVDEWFAQLRSHDELAAVAVAAFLDGATERTYRAELARFQQILARYCPAGSKERVRTDGGPGGPAREQPAPGLFSIGPVMAGPGTVRVVSLRERAYARAVLDRIWKRCDARFLSALRQWVYAVAGGPEQLRMAGALAELATVDAGEVAECFLEPWSAGSQGWSGMVSAIYVLWYMCREESTAPYALRTAVRWSDSPDRSQRLTAMMAFPGELGVTYPAEAARRLWRMTVVHEELRSCGAASLALLFAVLVDQTGEAGAVLAVLDSLLAGDSGASSPRPVRRAIREAVLHVLRVPSYRSGRPAVTDLLLGRPEWSGVIARLWTAALRTGSLRRDGLAALWSIVESIDAAGHPAALVGECLGGALSETLSRSERSRLRARLGRRAAVRRGWSAPVAARSAFLAALTGPRP